MPRRNHCQNLPFGGLCVIAQKLGNPVFFGQIIPDRRICGIAKTAPGCPRLGLLRGHRGLKPAQIHRTAFFAQRILRQVQRETEGVIQFERRRPRQIGPVGQPRQFIIQQLQPAVQRGFEPGFFGL